MESSDADSNSAVLVGTNIHSKGKLDTRKSGGGDDIEESEEEDYNNTYDNSYRDEVPSNNTQTQHHKSRQVLLHLVLI